MDVRVETHLPLKAVDFHVLLVLAEGELHGYGIVKAIEERSEGRIRLEPGNLYRYVRRLVEEGLVAPGERRPPEPSSSVASEGSASPRARRRYYRVTDLGRRVLAAEGARMRALATEVEARLTRDQGPA